MPPLSKLAAPLTAILLLTGTAALASTPAASADTNLVTNPGFETGDLSGWSCSPIDSVVTSPVHSGSDALAGAANNSDNAECSQVVAVQPSSSYTLTAWVQGNYVYIGDSGTGTSDTDNWTPSATSWQQLSTSFTTGSSTTSVTIYLHGWYAEGTYYADDVSLTGPSGGGGGSPPSAPTSLAVTGTTSSSVSLSWVAPSGTVTGYNIYENGSEAASTTGTSYTVTGLAAATSYTFAVTATNTSGESPQSNSVTATTQSSGGSSPPGAPTELTVTGTTSNTASLSWTAPSGTVTSYDVYQDGTQVTTSTTTSTTVTGLSASTTYSFTVAAVNSAGTGPQSTAVSATTAAPSLVSTPSGVHVTYAGGSSVTLAWDASTDSSGTGDKPAYHVYEGSSIVATSMGTTVTVSDLHPSTPYTFTVQAYDEAGYSSSMSSAVSVTTTVASTPAYRKVAYFDQWSIYGNAYYPRNIATSGAADKLNTVIYDFENIDPTNLTCFETIKAADSSNESDPDAGDGAGDAYADYQKAYDSGNSVDGSSDVYSQPLAGNFNQLRELKAEHPNLKILLSIGGWTYSKYFSDVAATAASRQKFVSSCIDMFLRGNLPTGIQGDPHGGPASAAGIFDGFDIDWEYPASPDGHVGNHYSAADTQNYTLLLQEFRNELDAYGQQTGRYYELSAALPSGQDKINLIQTGQIGQYLDFGDVETYDMHGGWENITNFQVPVHNSPSDPSPVIPPGNAKYNVDTSITAWTAGLPDYNIPGGFPASKLDLGVPYYWRGWTGVTAGSDHGLYQPATGPSASFTYSQTPGVADWKELVAAGLTSNASDNFTDSVSGGAWIYDGTNFYTGETPATLTAADSYLQSKGLGGVFAFSLDQDDPNSSLLNAMTNGLP